MKPTRLLLTSAAIVLLVGTSAGVASQTRPAAPSSEPPAAVDSTRPAVGDAAPGFTLRAAGGSSHSLAELRGKKNLVLIFFRGTW